MHQDGYLTALAPDQELPKFHWLQITGVAAEDDIGYSNNYWLVVSERVMGLLRDFELSICEIEEL